MQRSIILSSDSAIRQNSSNTPQNFTINFNRTIQFDQRKQYEVALVRCNASYSWHNIEASRRNNVVKYRIDGVSAWKTITFEDGIYSYKDIINYIHDVMVTNGDYTAGVDGNTFDINLDFSSVSFLCTISITGGYEFDFVSQAFGDLLGFDVGVITTTTTGVRLPNITNSLENIYIHSSLVMNSVSDENTSSDVAMVFSTAGLRRSYAFQVEPFNLIWNDLAGNQLSSVRVYITDNNNRIIDLNSIPTSFTFIVRQKAE